MAALQAKVSECHDTSESISSVFGCVALCVIRKSLRLDSVPPAKPIVCINASGPEALLVVLHCRQHSASAEDSRSDG